MSVKGKKYKVGKLPTESLCLRGKNIHSISEIKGLHKLVNLKHLDLWEN
ncbi:MAG: hypothetical protein ACFFFB_08195 [Candidatus Heimdallarchaeota archaeon]